MENSSEQRARIGWHGSHASQKPSGPFWGSSWILPWWRWRFWRTWSSVDIGFVIFVVVIIAAPLRSWYVFQLQARFTRCYRQIWCRVRQTWLVPAIVGRSSHQILALTQCRIIIWLGWMNLTTWLLDETDLNMLEKEWEVDREQYLDIPQMFPDAEDVLLAVALSCHLCLHDGAGGDISSYMLRSPWHRLLLPTDLVCRQKHHHQSE
jgi:hypothetical protein